MILAGHQPEHLPYIGFFHKIMHADIFMLVDHVQYTKKTFQNRNKIRNAHGSNGWTWLTVPVTTRGKFTQRICDVEINNESDWRDKHFKSIYYAYKGTPFFDDYIPLFDKIYSKKWAMLSELNETLIKTILKTLDINIKIIKSSSYNIQGKKTDMLINMCKAVDVDGYLSGQGGKNYVNETEFKNAGLSHDFLEFEHPIYQQKYKPFVPYMSIIDLLFNCGNKTKEIIRNE